MYHHAAHGGHDRDALIGFAIGDDLCNLLYAQPMQTQLFLGRFHRSGVGFQHEFESIGAKLCLGPNRLQQFLLGRVKHGAVDLYQVVAFSHGDTGVVHE